MKIDSIFNVDGVLKTIGVKILSINNCFIYIYSIYCHPVHLFPIWDRLFNSISSTSQIIITGDFNAHNVFWGCHSSSSDNSLFEVSQEFSLFLINDGIPTFISYSAHCSSVIDLTFVSSDLTLFCLWKSLDNPIGSDHVPSIITISHSVKSCSFFSHNLHTSKINRKHLFTSFLNQLLSFLFVLNLIKILVLKSTIFYVTH